MDKSEQILNLLVQKQIIEPVKAGEILESLKASNRNLVDFLIEEKVISEERLTEVRAEFYNLPYYFVEDQEIPEEILNFLPEEIAKNYQIICLGKEKGLVKIGLVEPNPRAMEAINFLASDEKLKVEYHLISRTSWDKLFKQYQKIEEEISTALELKAKEEGEDLVQLKDETSSLSDDDINSAPVSRIVSVVIRHAVEARASDIHIEPFGNESRVRYRIDGILHTSLTLPKSIHNAVIARVKVLAKLKLDETRIPQDGRIRLLINGREIDFRISTLPLANQEKVVMRILDTVKGAPTLEDLGFNKVALAAIKDGAKKTNGIFLVTGPTGSGKTTTLYALLNILNKEGVNISTLEDPIEYELKGINQSQVRPKIGFSFANGLRSLLRQDPNIIMVGEIRDEETAELSIHASLTGHLVLSTLHTNDALGSIFRLVDMNIEHFLLASTLKTIVAQRLARRLCSHCRKEVKPAPEMIDLMIEEFSSLSDEIIKMEWPNFNGPDSLREVSFYEAVGCSHCENTGFSGRIAIAEALSINDTLKEMINSGDKNLNLSSVRKSQDFISIKQDGYFKVLQGVTTMAEVLRVIES